MQLGELMPSSFNFCVYFSLSGCVYISAKLATALLQILNRFCYNSQDGFSPIQGIILVILGGFKLIIIYYYIINNYE